jgi:uncharacterized protein (DUF305 family)
VTCPARWVRSGAVAAALVVSSQACGGAPPEGGAPAPPAPSTAELEALYHARVDSALARFTDADADFMARMIGHHGQALEMAALAPARAESPEILTLAARITTAQEAEIALMRRWLEDRGLPGPGGAGPPGAPARGAHDADPEHATDSPGMLTPEEMRALESAAGLDFDRLFLSSMIRHHEGAVTMVERLFATPGAAQDASTFRIASGIQVDQRSEIARMESMLEALTDSARSR